ncbi:hypothetical protein HED60_15645 [Planctomycetales bacterium ZRK34]|nr:hypothetical protein HED60_15645 [Planctomycetales bacterium ZRK34]
MLKHLTIAAILAAAIVFVGGCQEQKTASLEPGIGQPEKPKKGFFESMAFWESDEPAEPEPVTYQAPEEEKEGLGDALWPGNWFKDDGRITADDVRWDMSPELSTLDATPEESKNNHARVIDTNTRQIWNDLDRILLLDRPSHLSLYSVP